MLRWVVCAKMAGSLLTLTTGRRFLPVLSAMLLTQVACSPASLPRQGPTPIKGSSQTVTVTGEYQPVTIDRIDRLGVEHGKLVLYGSSASVIVDLPNGADQAKANQQWALITESDANGTRTLTFTHEQSLDDFTISLPAGGAELRYGTLYGKTGDDVVVFAWGRNSRSYWGFVTVARPRSNGAHP